MDGLNRYFSDHMVLKRDSAIIPWSIEDATLQLASNEHVGIYAQLKLLMKVGAAVSGTGPRMMLNYEAVVHEIRNHRATVLWHAADNEIVTVAHFGFRPTDGVKWDIQLHMPTRQPLAGESA